LKSAWSLAMMPDTWLPTATVVTAETAPVAVTVWVTSPRSTWAVRYFGSDFFRLPRRRKSPPPAARMTTIQTHFFIALRENAAGTGCSSRRTARRSTRQEVYTRTVPEGATIRSKIASRWA
jgi:hypothetical protein